MSEHEQKRRRPRVVARFDPGTEDAEHYLLARDRISGLVSELQAAGVPLRVFFVAATDHVADLLGVFQAPRFFVKVVEECVAELRRIAEAQEGGETP